ncbi:PH domain protein [Dictyocaulus viviparus]|uniref:PH domain protein n=1 Tax=Dictyocaulus viviparus TaxID=29172 RepID=A0A0D8YDM6_DICVI|nr:PH domain protein [Dictyocaulus viviparus]
MEETENLRGRVATLRGQIQEKLNASFPKNSHLVPSSGVPNYPVLCRSVVPLTPLCRSEGLLQIPQRHIKPPLAPKPPNISQRTRLKSSESTPQVVFNVKESHESDSLYMARSSRDISRPLSTASTTSTENGDAADISDSDSEDGRRNSSIPMLHRKNSYFNGRARLSHRSVNNVDFIFLKPEELPVSLLFFRSSTVFLNGDPSIHDKIVDELKRQGIIKSSGRLKNREVETLRDLRLGNENSECMGSKSNITKNVRQFKFWFRPAIPHSLSQMIDWIALLVTGTVSRQRYLLSMKLCQITAQAIPKKQDRRLKKLHFAAKEFYSVQKLFLKYLRDMGEVYPEYVVEFGKRVGKDLLARQGCQLHVVRQIQIHFQQLIRVHQLLLDEFSSRLEVWNSLEPNMADVIIKYADFLKICKPFLLEKSRFAQELTQLRVENKDFDNATVAFEQKIFNRGVGAVVQQLDQVHQNFMRIGIVLWHNADVWYKLFSYAISKLEKIAQSVNESMGLPSNEDLFKLYDRFQCHFDVFYPGRRLIRQGEVLKQTRKEPQPRYLVLFSDILWICRVMSGFGSSGLFDIGRSYGIPIETVRTESNPHEDYEQQLYVKSKYKSLILIMSTARERIQWQNDINIAREEKRKYKKRMNEAIERQRKQSLNPLAFDVPLSKDIGGECQNNTSNPILPLSASCSISGEPACNGLHLTMSRCNSDSQDSSSHPSTPIDDNPGASITIPMTGKRKVLRADTVKPLWLPDDSSTKCLMEGCDTLFSFLNRRHHCRNCGWVSGNNAGTLFPAHLLVRGSDGILRIRVLKTSPHEKKFSLVEPQTLFLPPVNRRLKRMNIRERIMQNNGLVFGKVMLK